MKFICNIFLNIFNRFMGNDNISDGQKKSTQQGGTTNLSQEISQTNDICKNQLPGLSKVSFHQISF